MSDMGFFFGTQHPGTQIFYPTNAAGATATWQVWDKPRGCSMVFGVCLAGGGGGGNGFTGTAASARGGGAGGGSSASAKFMIPAVCLPDRLYLSVGKGGAANTAGDATVVSPVTAAIGTTGQIVSVGGGNGGANGAVSGAATGGTAGAVTAGASLLMWGLLTSNSGANGGTGGNATGVAGGNVTVGSGSPTSGGSGGGGTTSADFAGGNQSTPNNLWFPTITGATAGSNRGTDGYWSWGPQFVGGLGGLGGGSSNSSVGGAGGNGAYGSGGAGGGGGTTGGAGGRGGDGLVIIVAV